MRHGKKINHLSRTKPHRKAMLSNMACSLIQHKRINTTLAKAKALRGYVEPLITRSKNDNTHSRRVVFSYLNDKYAVSELFREVAPKVAERPGGYTRIIKTGNRMGDNAEMCMMELVDFNELYTSEKEKSGKKTRRRRRRGGGGGKKSAEATSGSEAKETKAADQGSKAAKTSSDDKAKAESKAEKTKEVKAEETDKASTQTEVKKEEKKESAAKSDSAKATKAEDSADKKEDKKD